MVKSADHSKQGIIKRGSGIRDQGSQGFASRSLGEGWRQASGNNSIEKVPGEFRNNDKSMKRNSTKDFSDSSPGTKKLNI
jgi:hypothetical protein